VLKRQKRKSLNSGKSNIDVREQNNKNSIKNFLRLMIRYITDFLILKTHIKNRRGAMEVGINADDGINESYKGAKSAFNEALKKSDNEVKIYGTDVPSIGLAKTIGFRIRLEKRAEGNIEIELEPFKSKNKSGVILRAIKVREKRKGWIARRHPLFWHLRR
jgi:hypothetical protein